MTNKILYLSFIVFIASGCGLLPVQDLSPTQKSELIRAASSTAIFQAIRDIYDKDEEVPKARELISMVNTALDLLQDKDSTLDETTERLLFAKIPLEYRAHLQGALTVLRMYYTTPETGDILSDEEWSYIESFFLGLREGAELVIIARESE